MIRVAQGDWLVRDSTGKIYPCKPDVFEAMYDEAETYRQPNDRFIQGYACAVATLIRLNEGATTDVKELFRGGLNMDTLGAHGVDEDDINIFRKYEN